MQLIAKNSKVYRTTTLKQFWRFLKRIYSAMLTDDTLPYAGFGLGESFVVVQDGVFLEKWWLS